MAKLRLNVLCEYSNEVWPLFEHSHVLVLGACGTVILCPNNSADTICTKNVVSPSARCTISLKAHHDQGLMFQGRKIQCKQLVAPES